MSQNACVLSHNHGSFCWANLGNSDKINGLRDGVGCVRLGASGFTLSVKPSEVAQRRGEKAVTLTGGAHGLAEMHSVRRILPAESLVPFDSELDLPIKTRGTVR